MHRSQCFLSGGKGQFVQSRFYQLSAWRRPSPTVVMAWPCRGSVNYSCEEDKLELESGALSSLLKTLPIMIKKKLTPCKPQSCCYTMLNLDSLTGFGNGLVDDELVLKVIASSRE